MIITHRRKDLKAGAVIYRERGAIILTSDYDNYHNGYSYKDIESDNNGGCIEVDNGGFVTPADLVGDEIF